MERKLCGDCGDGEGRGMWRGVGEIVGKFKLWRGEVMLNTEEGRWRLWIMYGRLWMMRGTVEQELQ